MENNLMQEGVNLLLFFIILGIFGFVLTRKKK